MKKVVSVSLGSSKRDHTVQVDLLGENFIISRIGTDGDLNKAIKMIGQLDGQVDAIGLGGIDVYLYACNKRYVIKDGLRMLKAAKVTPVVDGSGLKNTLERQTVAYLAQQGLLNRGSKVLMVSAMDRFGMAEAMDQIGCQIIFGDAMFALGIPLPIYTLERLQQIASKIMPIVSRLPFSLIYPTGTKQEKQSRHKATRFAEYYHHAEAIAGDYHFIHKYLPQQLNGQMIITNTTTHSDVELLTQRGAGLLVTTTPEFQGRTFGTNVIEALFLAVLGKTWGEVTAEEYADLLQKLNWQPKIIRLNKAINNTQTEEIPAL